MRVDSERDNLQSFDTSDPADTISKIREDKGNKALFFMQQK